MSVLKYSEKIKIWFFCIRLITPAPANTGEPLEWPGKLINTVSNPLDPPLLRRHPMCHFSRFYRGGVQTPCNFGRFYRGGGGGHGTSNLHTVSGTAESQ